MTTVRNFPQYQLRPRYYTHYMDPEYRKYLDKERERPEPPPEPGREEPPPSRRDEPAPTVTLRKSQATMSPTEQQRFISAIEDLIQSGVYGAMVGHHADMSHRMHGLMHGFIGYERFASWHRIFLIKLEREMQSIDERLFLPYWDWTVDRDIPGWLSGFTPQVTQVPGVGTVAVTRNSASSSDLPTGTEINMLLQVPDWSNFVRDLEDGPHNRVHGWVGGTMNNVSVSPADPLFWLHHAEVDRIWHRWQQAHPGLGTSISGTDAILDPWPETIADATDIADLDYDYA